MKKTVIIFSLILVPYFGFSNEKKKTVKKIFNKVPPATNVSAITN